MTEFDPAAAAGAIDTFDLLMTAGEAFEAFERLVTNAETRVVGCFRVFDLSTRLRSAEGRAHGETWFDLILVKLNDGVAFDITITDFDPTIATDDHRRSWRSARQLAGLAELSTNGSLYFDIAMHPARVGLLPRLALTPVILKERNQKDADPLTPGLAEQKADGSIELVPATHHQKLAVVDGHSLYIGGLDLNDRRYDTKDHERPASETWQDIQSIVTGPVVAAAAHHLTSFKSVVEGDADPAPRAPGFLRTLSRARKLPVAHISPKSVVTELEAAHLAAIKRATGPIYLETQFFRHASIADALVEAAQTDPGLTCMLVLPAAPEDVAFEGNRRQDAQLAAQKQMEALDILAEGFGPRLALAAPAQPRTAPETLDRHAVLHDAPIIYVHSKVSLFGTQEAILSSANLNGRSMHWDTEAGLHLGRPEHVQRCWTRVLNHWFRDVEYTNPFADGVAFINAVNTQLARNMVTLPEDRQHFLLPYPRGRDIDLAAPLPGVPDEMV